LFPSELSGIVYLLNHQTQQKMKHIWHLIPILYVDTPPIPCTLIVMPIIQRI